MTLGYSVVACYGLHAFFTSERQQADQRIHWTELGQTTVMDHVIADRAVRPSPSVLPVLRLIRSKAFSSTGILCAKGLAYALSGT